MSNTYTRMTDDHISAALKIMSESRNFLPLGHDDITSALRELQERRTEASNHAQILDFKMRQHDNALCEIERYHLACDRLYTRLRRALRWVVRLRKMVQWLAVEIQKECRLPGSCIGAMTAETMTHMCTRCAIGKAKEGVE